MVTREDIFKLVRQYAAENKREIPKNKIPVSGKVFNEEEIINGIDAVLDGWWTEGKYNEQFERKLANFLSIKHVMTVNSGSSANLLALKALTSHLIPEERRLKPNSEVISVAAAFPTTVNPIIQCGAIPVFLDVELGTYDVDLDKIEEAISPNTKAIFLAHTMGNPFNLEKIMQVCKNHNLWLIEDNCDALGSDYNDKKTGSFGDISTQSFYPAHHITTAEGGSIGTNNPLLRKIVISMRDWGRDCWCRTGKNDTCNKRYSWKLGDLPYGYDHKYIYSHIGYNLKMTDFQAAIGVAQMDKLSNFCEIRRKNFNFVMKRFHEENLDEWFIPPRSIKSANPCWFGLILTIKNKNINREKFLNEMNGRGIDTRLLFGGNITKQPYFLDYSIKYRIVGKLVNTDIIMNNTFWVGTYPGLNETHLEYMISQMKDYLKNYS